MSANPSCPSGTSAVGSDSTAPEPTGRMQKQTLDAIRKATLVGLTAHELSLVTGFDRHSIQPRISELRCKGLVTASGKRRRNPSGKTATVWIVSEYADSDPRSLDST